MIRCLSVWVCVCESLCGRPAFRMWEFGEKFGVILFRRGAFCSLHCYFYFSQRSLTGPASASRLHRLLSLWKMYVWRVHGANAVSMWCARGGGRVQRNGKKGGYDLQVYVFLFNSSR